MRKNSANILRSPYKYRIYLFLLSTLTRGIEIFFEKLASEIRG